MEDVPADATTTRLRARRRRRACADLVLVDGDPLDGVTHTRRVTHVWRGGYRCDLDSYVGSADEAVGMRLWSSATVQTVEPTSEPLVMYGRPSSARMLDWSWARAQLEDAGTYWVVARGPGHPHPRPVWGVWHADVLHLSVGSPIVASALDLDPLVTVHLGSDIDVVIVEGAVTCRGADAVVLRRYDEKYDWPYDVHEYGPLTAIAPMTVLAWRSAGWAGRDGFAASGRWRFTGPRARRTAAENDLDGHD